MACARVPAGYSALTRRLLGPTQYYLQYKNVRPDYLNAIWGVVNFADVARRLEEAKSN